MHASSWIYIISILFYHIDHVHQETLVKFITKSGYPAETHKIVTEDGYILKTHRIPHGKFNNKTNDNLVFLAHGMAGSAEHYIMLGPDDALAFFLADRGFDVWLFNARGTRHSRKHQTRSPNYFQRPGFWNFSWHEIGVYDIPANIDYILNKTNKSSMFYVGHSQGGTSYFIMTSEKTEYNKKIKAAVLLSPAVLMEYTTSTMMKFLSRFSMLLERIAVIFSYYELVIPNSNILNSVFKSFCTSSSNFMEACKEVVSFIAGEESNLVNVSLIPRIVEYTPTGFSIFQPLHYGQIIRNGNFSQYDYGEKINLIKYNSTVPPRYNISDSVVPVALFMASGDNVVSIKSTQELSKILPNVEIIYEVPYDNFNHLDYLVAHNAKSLVYEPVLDFIMQYITNE